MQHWWQFGEQVLTLQQNTFPEGLDTSEVARRFRLLQEQHLLSSLEEKLNHILRPPDDDEMNWERQRNIQNQLGELQGCWRDTIQEIGIDNNAAFQEHLNLNQLLDALRNATYQFWEQRRRVAAAIESRIKSIEGGFTELKRQKARRVAEAMGTGQQIQQEQGSLRGTNTGFRRMVLEFASPLTRNYALGSRVTPRVLAGPTVLIDRREEQEQEARAGKRKISLGDEPEASSRRGRMDRAEEQRNPAVPYPEEEGFAVSGRNSPAGGTTER